MVKPAPSRLPIPSEDAYLAFLSLETVAAYRGDLPLFFQHSAGDAGGHLTDLALPKLRAFIRSLVELGAAPASIARYLSALKSYCGFLCDEGELDRDPSQNLQGPRQQRYKPAS